MKAMKALSVNKVLGSIKRKTKSDGDSSPPNRESCLAAAPGCHGSLNETPGASQILDGSSVSAATHGDSPEATAHNSVKAFCESGSNAQSDEVLFLPPIVEAAESSPAAAAECARVLHKYLGKEYFSRPSWQYNALMLVRILTDNPGDTFTRNLDGKFVDTARALLKHVRDLGVRQLMMEMLDDFELNKAHDANLAPLVAMWKKEKEKALKDQGVRNGGTVLLTRRLTLNAAKGRMPPLGPRPSYGSQQTNGGGGGAAGGGGGGGDGSGSQNYFARSHNNNQLPTPAELANRLEEARTSGKLLEQVVMNTAPGDLLHNDLVREFANRCLSASRSIQGYMTSENPAPDNDTMEQLIDTNEQLQAALSQHQRALLSARKQSVAAQGGEADESVQAAGRPLGGARDSPRDFALRNGGTQQQQDALPMVSGAGSGSGGGLGLDGFGIASSPGWATTTTTTSTMNKGKQAEIYDAPEGTTTTTTTTTMRLSYGRSGRSGEIPVEDPFADGHVGGTTGTNGRGNALGYAESGYSAPRHQPPPPPPPPPPVQPPATPATRGVARGDDEDDIYEATPKSKRSVTHF